MIGRTESILQSDKNVSLKCNIQNYLSNVNGRFNLMQTDTKAWQNKRHEEIRKKLGDMKGADQCLLMGKLPRTTACLFNFS